MGTDLSSWANLNRDGRRLERIIKQMDTRQKEESEPSLRFAYIDRLLKATHTKIAVAEMVLNVRAVLAEAKKKVSVDAAELIVAE